jgi:hypothetical protein
MVSSVSEPLSKSDMLVPGASVFAKPSSTQLEIGEAEWNALDTTGGAETIFGAIFILIESGAVYND